ncbi:unnamed protein product [Cuscuta europaea]|uniref:Uncharacterized protein n=1 Tax=Cuscuta europaea TaxID=41803 RepID=A0A9P0YUN4_CUSEU|nr:unnamed protein product [Cuscuta europaea]
MQPSVVLPDTTALSASSFTSPSKGLGQSYTLFQNLPPTFPWSASPQFAQPSMDPPPSFSAPTATQPSVPTIAQFSGPTFVGSPGISSSVPATRTAPLPLSNFPMADLAHTLSHVATNVTNIWGVWIRF